MRIPLVVILFACSKSSERAAGSGSAPGSGSSVASGSSAPPAPTEAATVVGPTKSAKGQLEVAGLVSGKFEWSKKDQTAPISCAWSVEKEIGGLRVDLSDGAGHILKVTIDIPPPDVGVPRLDVASKDLPHPLKTKLGFNMSGDDAGNIEVKFDAKLAEGDEEAAPAKKGAKKDDKPALTMKGTLEVTCPRKK
jgi:hypothetical protein